MLVIKVLFIFLFLVIAWVGNETSEKEQKNALTYAKNYLGYFNKIIN
jgi:hypothetical protein